MYMHLDVSRMYPFFSFNNFNKAHFIAFFKSSIFDLGNKNINLRKS